MAQSNKQSISINSYSLASNTVGSVADKCEFNRYGIGQSQANLVQYRPSGQVRVLIVAISSSSALRKVADTVENMHWVLDLKKKKMDNFSGSYPPRI